MSAKKVNRRSKEYYILAILTVAILLLSAINLNTYLKPDTNTVLAAETENVEIVFWQNFLTNNPSYIPGWMDLGREDKVRSIDPNYIIP